ncbi:2-oxoglutarate dehydrogenase complex dihydrolipoyllysine-residue succinyltransferase [Acinetobacter sichuanensis]|uniref:Dihydrolipoyllysine-residue succinyltransferase component of 2-oxoglutarate dehydrogenase complex n=1 Tax=Acinetobacter sichuanensis TaxID=2136183 RepID=A0A371YTY6_9GAMM|nr:MULTISPECIES: 2-oxoglutarate dehydrogenase complex dihydrolipoyllysine-residue succinyltransferase [Acinetobacter]MDM1246957.1 2-oxoglutarate dehydrogenase complex dihydrolipoyllysine-residue succinyltransferase [Acinetobacter sp. R933-2]MDM1763423.1 2-oxoglutarate dehydrogenase complex dihydrolipoyllysine-residue succinyltransferase [Acinetobacter sp. 226-1]MDM1766902.1 2-oxoglutarate dehydrogenase complex dihydrolipoyllysine-residue succinyltransferase [Acinetobacter sp. 226-4]MDQ9019619.1
MATEIKAPVFPESVADGTIATWHKQPGEAVSRDEVICDIETDKVVLEVVAPADGSISAIIKNEGDTVLSAEVIATFEAGAVSGAAQTQAVQSEEKVEQAVAQTQAGNAPVVERAQVADQAPAVRKALSETGIAAADVDGTGRGGRITKEDVANHQAKPAASVTPLSVAVGERVEKRVPMTRLRKRVAERLLAATQQTAMLTTFNEVNMKPIMEMRAQYKDAFEKRHGARLGFMSFFVKAATEALKRYPAVNASIDGDDIVYHGFYDIGVAVSSERGLVVPVLRDTDRMNYAEVENGIRAYAGKARDGKLGIEDMTGGTFTITNGGTFGSLLSTPILNTPQTAILGMHKIQERPMAVNGQVEILPMMYLALSYDHRLIDGKEAVGFLVAIKELLEEPARLILDL